MSVKVISPGLWTTIQDRGRLNMAQYGVPQGGAMDKYAAKMANLLVGNHRDMAFMEITLLGPELYFSRNSLAAVSGLAAEVTLNDREVELNTVFKIQKGDILKIGRITEGARAYLAIQGGFQTEKVLGSRCFYEGITSVSKIRAGQELPLPRVVDNKKPARASVKFKRRRYQTAAIKAYRGPEWKQLSKAQQEALLRTKFTVSKNNNRQAYQLSEKFKNQLNPILTQPVLPGTVQLTPAGNLIILMRDGQSTGGYPRILQLDAQSINLLAQKRQGDPVEIFLKEQEE